MMVRDICIGCDRSQGYEGEFFLTSRDYIVTDISDDLVNLLGYSLGELMGKTLNEISIMLRIDSQSMLDKINDKVTVYIFNKSLKVSKVTILCQVIESSRERWFYFKEHPVELIENQFHFAQQLHPNRETGVVLLSYPDLVILNANKGYINYLRKHDQEKENILGKRYKDVMPPNIGDAMERDSRYIEKIGEPYYVEESQVIYPTGEIKYWSTSTIPMFQDSELKYIIFSIIDVTERIRGRQAEESFIAKIQYDLLNRIIENLKLGLVKFSYPELEIIDMNSNFIDDFVVDLSSSKAKFPHIKNKRYFMQELKRVVNETSGVFAETKQINILGEERFFRFIYQPLFKLNKKVNEIVIMTLEITEQVVEKNKLEKILKVQEELLLNVSHECRTPLNIIFSTCQLMELYLRGDLNDEVKKKMIKNIASIKQNCNRFIKIINNVIDLSQIESEGRSLNLRNEEIISKIEEMVDSVIPYSLEKGLNIIFDTNVEEKYMAVDIEKIERAILNLISNAIKFSDKGCDIYISISDKGNIIEIYVEDRGIGIEQRYQEYIFDRFAQVDKSLVRTAEGSGIGLSLVKAIVEMHDGKISVESRLGKGSKFKIELPVTMVKEPQGFEQHRNFDMINNRLNIEFSDIY